MPDSATILVFFKPNMAKYRLVSLSWCYI